MTTLLFAFGWKTAFKLVSGLLLLGVWLMARQQSRLDAEERKARENASSLAGRRIFPTRQLVLVGAAIAFLILSLLWGNTATI